MKTKLKSHPYVLFTPSSRKEGVWQFSLRKITHRITAPWMIVPRIIALRTITPEDTCPRRKQTLRKLPPRILIPPSPPENYLFTTNFPLKTISPTQANSLQTKLRVNSENYALSTSAITKESLYQKLFFKAATKQGFLASKKYKKIHFLVKWLHNLS